MVPDTITLGDLIRLRVREEVARYNAGIVGRPSPLVRRPGDGSQAGVTVRRRGSQKCNWEREAERALACFASNAYFVMVAGQQVTDLDELINCDDSASVVFIPLVPLVGG
jgi:hypothetical protein